MRDARHLGQPPLPYGEGWGEGNGLRLNSSQLHKDREAVPSRPTLAQFARQLRTNQTDCEHLLWQRLSSRQIANL
jgi:hypothetical protein